MLSFMVCEAGCLGSAFERVLSQIQKGPDSAAHLFFFPVPSQEGK